MSHKRSNDNPIVAVAQGTHGEYVSEIVLPSKTMLKDFAPHIHILLSAWQLDRKVPKSINFVPLTKLECNDEAECINVKMVYQPTGKALESLETRKALTSEDITTIMKQAASAFVQLAQLEVPYTGVVLDLKYMFYDAGSKVFQVLALPFWTKDTPINLHGRNTLGIRVEGGLAPNPYPQEGNHEQLLMAVWLKLEQLLRSAVTDSTRYQSLFETQSGFANATGNALHSFEDFKQKLEVNKQGPSLHEREKLGSLMFGQSVLGQVGTFQSYIFDIYRRLIDASNRLKEALKIVKSKYISLTQKHLEAKKEVEKRQRRLTEMEEKNREQEQHIEFMRKREDELRKEHLEEKMNSSVPRQSQHTPSTRQAGPAGPVPSAANLPIGFINSASTISPSGGEIEANPDFEVLCKSTPFSPLPKLQYPYTRRCEGNNSLFRCFLIKAIEICQSWEKEASHKRHILYQYLQTGSPKTLRERHDALLKGTPESQTMVDELANLMLSDINNNDNMKTPLGYLLEGAFHALAHHFHVFILVFTICSTHKIPSCWVDPYGKYSPKEAVIAFKIQAKNFSLLYSDDEYESLLSPKVEPSP